MIVDVHAHYQRPGADVRHASEASMHALAGAERDARRSLPGGVPYQTLLDCLDNAGVDKLVAVTPGVADWDNRYSIEGAQAQPHRVRVIVCVDPLRPAVIDEFHGAISSPYVVGVRVLFLGRKRSEMQSASAIPFWVAAERANVPISIYSPGGAALIGQLARRHEGLRILVDHATVNVIHGCDPSRTFDGWQDLRSLSRLPNIWVKASGLAEATGERFPFLKARQRFLELYDWFGPDRVMWGSNYPPSLRAGSYEEVLEAAQLACAALPRLDRDKIFSGTVIRVLGLPWW